MKMKPTAQKSKSLIAALTCLLLLSWAGPLWADEDYDPKVIMEVPHQPILNNESLPGTTGNTGALAYSIPIKVAPGRGGLQPQLALTYNSSSRKNSWVGVGWSLDLGSIERSKKQRVNFNDNDAFVLNGSVELVRRTDWGGGYYGARIEGEFVKFRYLGNARGWKVFYPDGSIHYFGTSSQSQLKTSLGVFRWLLDEIEDANGNSMTVLYQTAAGENIYPHRISYNPTNSIVDFELERRSDAYSTYSGHTRVHTGYRLKEILCYGRGYQAHRYVLSYDYSDHSGRSLLTGVQEYGATNSTVLPAISFDYEQGNTVRFRTEHRHTGAFVNDPGMTHFADINGDGYTDLIKFRDLSLRTDVYLSDGNGQFGGNSNSQEMDAFNSKGNIHFGDINGDGKADCVTAKQEVTGFVQARAYLGDEDGNLNFTGQVLGLHYQSTGGMTQLADVNGDGRADLIEFPSTTGMAMVHPADPDGDFDESTYDTSLCAPNSPGRIFMADVNGDGMADVIQTNSMNTSAYVHLSRGNGRFDDCVATDLGAYTDPGSVSFADINGDGFSDLILSPSTSEMVHSFLSDGNGGFVFFHSNDTGYPNHAGYVHFGDVSGDGFADMVKCDQFGRQIRLFLGNGTGAFASENYLSTANDGFAALVDINNDGLSDLIKFKTLNRYVYAYMAEGLADGGVRPDILNAIDNGYGVTADISYRPSTDYGGIHQPSGSFPDAYLPYPLDLVDAIVVHDGIGNTATTSYDYRGGHYHIAEREFLGLGRIWRRNPNNTTLTTTYHVGNYYLKGRASRAKYEDNTSSDYLNTTYAWNTVNLQNGATWVRMDRQQSTLRSGGTAVTSNADYDYQYDRSDDFGYLYETIQSGSGEANLTTRTTYANEGGSGEWILRVQGRRTILGGTTARRVDYAYDSNGNLTRETHQNNDGSDGVIERDYDGYGNVNSETDLNGNTTGYAYTAGTYLYRQNFEGLMTTYTGYNRWGKPERVQDPNGGLTRYAYDQYGRVTNEDYPGPGSKSITYHDTARPRYTVTAVTDGTTTYEYMDGLDRPLQATVSSAEGREITTRTYYDNAGRVTKTAGPFFTSGYGYYTGATPSGAPYRDIEAFDFLNRPQTMVSAGDSGTAVTRIAYSGFNRTVTDADGKSTTENRDYLGRIQSIRDADGNVTTYDYTGADDMTQVRDAMGHRITMTRNTLGHMTQLDDPDLGRWHFTYQAGGEVKTRQDEKGQTITFWYNDRNQLTSKSYSSESPEEPDVSLVYDSANRGIGRLYQVTKGDVGVTYSAYDEMGRVLEKAVTIDGVNYRFAYTYDAAGNLTSIEHPDGYTVNYSYHSKSNLIATVWASGPDVDVDISDYNHFGKPGRIAYPASSTDIDYYKGTGRVRGITVPGMMALSYHYSKAGDVLSIDDTVRNFAYTYDYDDLHRLTRETVSGPFRLAESRNIDLYYEGTEAHAVSRVVTDQGERNLIYEDNGNLTMGYDFSKPGAFPERRLAYNAENMPLTLEYEPEGGAVTTVAFTYDGDGRRVKKESGTDTVIYVDATYEIRNGQPVKYIFAGNQRVAKVVGSTVQYYHKDHLGSSAVVTDSGGFMTESLVYEAYGQPRATCAPSSGDMAYTYTDQEWDAESGLYNYDARMYDPVLGRFLSADSVVPDWYDPQALDRFAYARNNPIKYIDPDGNAWQVPVIIIAGAAAAFAYDAFVTPDIAETPAVGQTQLQTSPSIGEHIGSMATGAGLVVTAAYSGTRALLKEAGEEIVSAVSGGLTDLSKAIKKAPSLLKRLRIKGASKNILGDARTARDKLAQELGPLPGRKRPATVTAGYNTETGEVAARACGGGKCAEDHVVEALGGDKSKVKFTEAARPRPHEPPYREVPVCPNCEKKYGRDAFPNGTTFKSDL